VAVAGPRTAAPDPGVLVALARSRLAAGWTTVVADAVVPCYLREADVRINWASRSPLGDG